jgi:hypothetical protein
MNYSSSGGGNSSLTNGSGSSNNDTNHESHPSNGIVAQNETNQLTSELQLIENTIKDREREIIVNRSTDMTDNANGGAANLEYGSYLSQGVISSPEDNGVPQRTTTTATTTLSGEINNQNANCFNPM